MDDKSIGPERRSLERLWFDNFHYYAGAQWFERGRIVPRTPRGNDPNRVRHQANMTLVKVLRAVSRLLQVNGTLRVAPHSGHREDRHAAKMAETVFEHLKQATSWHRRRAAQLLDAAIYGSGVMKVTFDPSGGRPLRLYMKSDRRTPDIEAHLDHTGKLRQEKEREGLFRDIAEGEVALSNPTPFQLHWDPACRTSFEDQTCSWASQVSYVPTSWVKERYGAEVEADGDVSQAELYERAIAFSAQLAGEASGASMGLEPRSMQGKLVRLIEFFERPLKSNGGRGRYILVAGDQVIRNDWNPYVASENPIPFVKMDWFPIRGRFIGGSLVEQLRPAQRAYNFSRSHEMGYQKASGHAKVFLPKGSGVKAVQMVALHGPIYEYNAGVGPPVFAPAPNMPPYIAENRNVARQEMDLIAGQSDPTDSKLPGQLRSGQAIGLMQADNNLILTLTSEEALRSAAATGTQMLQVVSTHYDEPRVIQVLGRGNEFDVREFTGADLKGHTQIRVFGEPGRLETAEAWRATVSDMVELGLLNAADPQDRMLALKALNFHTADELLNVKLLQETDEERILQRMIEDPAYMPEVMPFHDPEVRMRVLERELNSKDFEEHSPDVQGKLVMRWQAMTVVYQRRIEAQMELMAATQGAPGEKGQASQPRRSVG